MDDTTPRVLPFNTRIVRSGDFVFEIAFTKPLVTMLSARLFRRPLTVRAFADDASPPATKTKVKFAVKQRLQFGTHIAVTGSWSKWNPTNGVALHWQDDDVWAGEIELPVEKPGQQVELKFLVLDNHGHVVEWAPGENVVVVVGDAPEVEIQAEGLDTSKVNIHKVGGGGSGSGSGSTTSATATTDAKPTTTKTKTTENSGTGLDATKFSSNGVASTAPTTATSTPLSAKEEGTPIPSDLEKMTIASLKVLAGELRVEFKAKGKKADLIAAIRKAIAVNA